MGLWVKTVYLESYYGELISGHVFGEEWREDGKILFALGYSKKEIMLHVEEGKDEYILHLHGTNFIKISKFNSIFLEMFAFYDELRPLRDDVYNVCI
jgi:hypothetical protein